MKKLIGTLWIIFLIVVVASMDNVLAQTPFESINQKLEQIQYTLDNQVLPKLDECCPKVGVPRTGQTTSYGPRDDGALQKGIAWPVPRFIDNGNGTVTDNLTGLIWLKNANCFGPKTWADALNDCNTLASGSCDLTDGSQAGDWRLPNRKELESLMDFGNDTVLPFRPPFVNFGWKYWTSTNSWFIESNGVVDATSKEVLWSVWPVRDSK